MVFQVVNLGDVAEGCAIKEKYVAFSPHTIAVRFGLIAAVQMLTHDAQYQRLNHERSKASTSFLRLHASPLQQ